MLADWSILKINKRTWFSLVLVLLLFFSILLTQFATLQSRDDRSQAAGPSLTFSYSRPKSYWTMKSTTCSNNGNISGTTTGISAKSGTYEFSPYCYVTWTARPVNDTYRKMKEGSGNANGVGTFSINWSWEYDMRIYPVSSGNCSSAGANCKLTHRTSDENATFQQSFSDLLYGTTYLGDICAPDCNSSGNWADTGIVVGTTIAAPPPPPPPPPPDGGGDGGGGCIIFCDPTTPTPTLVSSPVSPNGPKLTPVGQQSSQPANSGDITLNFATNLYLKGGMEVIVNIDSASVSQKIVVDSKGGSFILNPGTLTKGAAYNLRISSKNSLIVVISFTYGDNLSLSVPELATGDFNNDNQINETDLDKLKGSGFNSQDSLYDINYDSVVNSIDYSLLLRNLGKKGN